MPQPRRLTNPPCTCLHPTALLGLDWCQDCGGTLPYGPLADIAADDPGLGLLAYALAILERTGEPPSRRNPQRAAA